MLFETTHWSMVYAAGGANSEEARRALETLCIKYWRPLFHFARRRGLSIEEAQDMTQEFFARLLAQQSFDRIDRTKGKFRTFLLSSFTNMLNNEWNKQHTLKRNPGKPFLPLSVAANVTSYNAAVSDNVDPELLFDREWAMAVLREALESLRARYEAKGKRALLERLEPYLTANGERQSYDELAHEFGFTTNSIKVAVHRMRKRYGEEIRGHIAETVQSEDEVDEELHYLLNVLTRSDGTGP